MIETVLIYPCFTDENVEVQGSEWLAQSHVNISDGAEIRTHLNLTSMLFSYYYVIFPPGVTWRSNPVPIQMYPGAANSTSELNYSPFPTTPPLTGAIHLCPPKLDNWTHWDAGSWLCFPSNHTFHWLSSPHCHYTALTHALILGPMGSHPGGAVCWQSRVAEGMNGWRGQSLNLVSANCNQGHIGQVLTPVGRGCH